MILPTLMMAQRYILHKISRYRKVGGKRKNNCRKFNEKLIINDYNTFDYQYVRCKHGQCQDRGNSLADQQGTKLD